MAEKIATREAYGNALAEFGEKYPNFVVLDADLAAATKTGVFKKKFPERFFDCGIAEGNMMSVAAGLAAAGKIPFASTFAMFAAGRAFEQIRNSIGYPHLNVKIGATHAGITVGEDGATHQCNEDLATMRSIPGMTIINPADAVEARAAVEAAINYVGPVYLRFGRLAIPVFNDAATYKFEWGKGVQLAEGKDVTIIATGVMVDMAMLKCPVCGASMYGNTTRKKKKTEDGVFYADYHFYACKHRRSIEGKTCDYKTNWNNHRHRGSLQHPVHRGRA